MSKEPKVPKEPKANTTSIREGGDGWAYLIAVVVTLLVVGGIWWVWFQWLVGVCGR